MAKSVFQSKNQSKKVAAVHKRAYMTAKNETPALAASQVEQSTVPKDAGNATTGQSVVKTMPVNTTAIGSRVLRIVDGPVRMSNRASTHPAQSIKPKAMSVSKGETKSNTATPVSATAAYTKACSPPQNAWSNAAGLTKVKSVEKVMMKPKDCSSTPGLPPKPVVAKTARMDFPGLPALPQQPALSSNHQTFKKDPKKTKTAVALKTVAQEVTKKSLHAAKLLNGIQQMTTIPGNTKPIHALDDSEKTVNEQGEDATASRGVEGLFASNPSPPASPEPSATTKKSKKKSGAAQKKAKAARHRAAAEANLDAACAAASLEAAKLPLPTNIEELETFYSNKPEREDIQKLNRIEMVESLMVLQSKNIDIEELGAAGWFLQDKNGRHLSDEDQEIAAAVCKAYKCYQTLCEADAFAQRAKEAVAKASEVQRNLGVISPALDSCSGRNEADYEEVSEEKDVAGTRKARRSSPPYQTLPRHSVGQPPTGEFTFENGKDAPHFGQKFPVDVPKMRFSADAFATPNTDVQDPVSGRPLSATISPLQLDKALDVFEDSSSAEHTGDGPGTAELELPVSPTEGITPVLLTTYTTEVEGFNKPPIIDGEVSAPGPKEDEAYVRETVDEAIFTAVPDSHSSLADSPVLATIDSTDVESLDVTAMTSTTVDIPNAIAIAPEELPTMQDNSCKILVGKSKPLDDVAIATQEAKTVPNETLAEDSLVDISTIESTVSSMSENDDAKKSAPSTAMIKYTPFIADASKTTTSLVVAIKRNTLVFPAHNNTTMLPIKLEVGFKGIDTLLALAAFAVTTFVPRGFAMFTASIMQVHALPVAIQQPLSISFVPTYIHDPSSATDAVIVDMANVVDYDSNGPLRKTLRELSRTLTFSEPTETIVTVTRRDSSDSIFAKLQSEILEAHERAVSSGSESDSAHNAPEMMEVPPLPTPKKAGRKHKLPDFEKRVLVREVASYVNVSYLQKPSELSSSATEAVATEEEIEPDAHYARQCNTLQIGIITMREFFDELGDGSSSKCSKTDVISTFMTLSTREQTQLELEPGRSLELAAVLAIKRLQYKVFMGNIKLADFLNMIMFDEHGAASKVAVARAFKECAEKDAELEVLPASLARMSKEMGWCA